MTEKQFDADPYISLRVGRYEIDGYLGSGQIGSVYRAVDRSVGATVACKFIAEPRDGWENEITKVNSLHGIPHIVGYRDHGTITVNDKPVLYIFWDYIPSRSLKQVAESGELGVDLLSAVVRATLIVLGSCQSKNLVHADLHWGNILIQDQDPSIRTNERLVWVTDFGYYTVSMGVTEEKSLLDDLRGLANIVSQCLTRIDFHFLSERERHVYRALKEWLPKCLHETSPVEANYARNAHELYAQWETFLARAEEDSTGRKRLARIDDYPAAEMIGERWDEWRDLFVAECIGAQPLTSRSIVVLTGVRGCGKSMLFRRLTAFYDLHLGVSEVPGANEFLGFYMNARYLAEAFPWLPKEKEVDARLQILHYFNICWTLEVLEWLIGLDSSSRPIDCIWLLTFFRRKFEGRGAERFIGLSFESIHDQLVKERERSRLKTKYSASDSDWPLTDINFLNELWDVVTLNTPCVSGRPMHCFLDDYSTPLVSPVLQRILNPIVFSRRSNVFFKISTEDVWSFERQGLGGKFLEEGEDFTLVNLSTEGIRLTDEGRLDLLSRLLAPRISRHNSLKGKSLEDVLGPTPYSFNCLARALRGDTDPDSYFSPGKGGKKPRILYGGSLVFSSIWSNDTREIIRVFSTMIDEAIGNPGENEVPTGSQLVPMEIQDKVLREVGGTFLNSRLSSAICPTDELGEQGTSDRSYGEHLCKIAKAFQQIAEHELQTKTSKNESSNPPKQARRIEISDTDRALPDDLHAYYLGLLRYGVFIRDYRGKSVRNQVTSRLVLRGLLIPYFTLSPSKRDSVTMDWDFFCRLLKEPEIAAKAWISGGQEDPAQILLPGMELAE